MHKIQPKRQVGEPFPTAIDRLISDFFLSKISGYGKMGRHFHLSQNDE